MAQSQTRIPKAEFFLKSIDILNSSMDHPADPDTSFENLKFNIGVQSKLDSVTRMISVEVSADVITEDAKTHLGAVSVSFLYQMVNFEEVFKLNAHNEYEMPPGLAADLSVISYSTTRGVMFAIFKGTFLHNAILPLIDPGEFRQS